METKITTVSLAAKEDKYYADKTLYQWNYGQILRIVDADLPMAVEIGFSTTEKSGDSDVRVGSTNNGVTTVAIPNKLFEEERSTDYSIYAFVYVTDENSGTTVHEIVIPVKARAKQGDPSEDPSIDPSIFKDAINAVNASAERAEIAEKSAKESADKAKEYAESAGKSKGDVEKARDNAISAIGIEKESALRGIESKTVESLQKIQSQTEASQNSIKQSIADATEKKTELDGAISNATDAKGNLDKAVQSAGNAKKELESSIGKAGEANTALDSAISSAGEKQLALDTTVEQANEVDASLKEQIGSAEQIQANVEQIAKNKADISSLKEDLGNKITKFYASNQGETHLADSDNGKIMDMMLYGRSEQKQYKGINLFPPNTRRGDFIEVSIPKGTKVFAITDGTNFNGGNFRFFNADKTENMWFGIEKDTTIATYELKIDAKYVQNLLEPGLDFSKICLGIGSEPIYEPYIGGIPSPSPDYPQEIKRVVNPTMKVRGKNLVDIYGYSASGIPSPEAEKVLFNTYGTTISTTEKTDKLIVSQEIIDGATADNYTSGYFCVGINPKLEDGKYYIVTFKINVIQNPFHVSDITVMFNGIDAYMAQVVGDKVKVKAKYNEFSERQYVEFRTRGMSLELSNFMITEVGETDDYEPYTEQSVQLPYTLNAIPVASGGNVTIDGQQYIADRVVEKDGVFGIERNTATDVPVLTKELRETPDMKGRFIQDGALKKIFTPFYETLVNIGYSRKWGIAGSVIDKWIFGVNKVNLYISPPKDLNYTSEDIFNALKDLNIKVYGALLVPLFEPLPGDIQAKLRTLVTNYPVTNISVTSDQLDGYTVFNYPISMANGWNYVKQQLNDNRDYIYDMDIQSAEAYVNSEYAVALTELEV